MASYTIRSRQPLNVTQGKLKDKTIKVYRKTTEINNVGMPVTVYRPIHPGVLWAYFRQLSGREIFQANAAQVQETVLFVVNWRPEYASKDDVIGLYIEYKGIWYDITRMDILEDYKRDVQIFCKLGTRPKETDILPYE